ncbi:MAG: DUF2723 domain-containing protein [Candidatus Eisenbacteria bacterium]|nr:DUF2723 domain-containing protein [Candidatus Eisenbacteria bacterium]
MRLLLWKHLALAGVAGISLFIYLRTCAPSLYGGDSSELASAAWFLGIPHPPGYPLYVITGRLFSLIPIGDVALRLNLMSAFWAVVGTCFVFLLASELTGKKSAAAGCALVFAFSRTFWTQAVMAEVYTMSTALVAAFLFFLARWWRSSEERWYFASCLFLGFAILSHQSSVCLIPIFVGVVIVNEVRLKRRSTLEGGSFSSAMRRAGSGFLFFLLGLSPILVLPLRSRLNPTIDWGNPESLRTIVENLSRVNYGPLTQNPFSFELFFSQLGSFGVLLGTGFTVLLIPVGIIGLFHALRRKSDWAGWSFALFLLSFASVSLVINPRPDPEHSYQIQAFLLPAFLVFSVWIGEGFVFLEKKVGSHFEKSGARLSRVPGVILILALPLIPLSSNYSFADKSSNNVARQYGEDLLSSVPKGGTLIVEGDNESFLSFYLQKVEGVRKDITIYQRKGYLFDDIYHLNGLPRKSWRERQEEVELHIIRDAKKPVFFSLWRDGRELKGYKTSQEGLLRKIEPSNSSEEPRMLVYDLGGFPKNPRREDYITRKMMVAYLDSNARRLDEEGKLNEAYPLYREAAQIGFDFAPARFNFGLAAFRLGDFGTAYEEFLETNSLDPSLRGLQELLGYLTALASGGEEGAHRQ